MGKKSADCLTKRESWQGTCNEGSRQRQFRMLAGGIQSRKKPDRDGREQAESAATGIPLVLTRPKAPTLTVDGNWRDGGVQTKRPVAFWNHEGVNSFSDTSDTFLSKRMVCFTDRIVYLE